MQEIANDVYLLNGIPNYLINVYLVGDVLIDAGTKMATRGLMKQLKGKDVRLHALTHIHPDHQGASHPICTEFNIPLWCGAKEVNAMENGDMSQQIPRNVITNAQNIFWAGDAHPVDKGLVEGDDVGGFTVIDVPGHSPGHIAFWRESDRLLIAGDVLTNINFITLQERLSPPPDHFTINPRQNLASAHKLASLSPRIVCLGHGKPILDGTKFVDYVQMISEDASSMGQ